MKKRCRFLSSPVTLSYRILKISVATAALLTQRKTGSDLNWPSPIPAPVQRSLRRPTLPGTPGPLCNPWSLLSSLALKSKSLTVRSPPRSPVWLTGRFSVPPSDVFCWCSSLSSSSDSAPFSRSLLPFSMLLLELPAEVRVTPNLPSWKKTLARDPNHTIISLSASYRVLDLDWVA